MPDAPLMLVTLDYPPMTGGVANYLQGLVDASQGKIDVIVPNVEPFVSAFPSEIEGPIAGGTGRTFLDKRSGRKSFPGDRTRAPQEVRLVSLLQEKSPSWQPAVNLIKSLKGQTRFVLVSHVFPIGTAAWLSRMTGGPDYVVIFHGLDVKLADSFKKRWMLKEICRHATVCIANSEATKQELYQRAKTARGKTFVLTPAIEDRPLVGRAEARAALRLDATRPLALTVARLVPRKGIDTLMLAMADLQKRMDVDHVVIGSGTDRGRLDAAAEACGAQTRFVQVADDEEKWLWYTAADVFALTPNEDPSDMEGFGIVYLEAALAGLPCVATKTGGVAEAVQDGVTGLLAPPGSSDAIRDKLEQLLADDGLRKKLGDSARARVRRDFAWPERWRRLCEALNLNS